ncbi:kinase-like domain-containing protein [Crucibulum laeve]|uniref:Kinase-like domain-containing protein n=1 Tax=Crucibulum laeve TaxID=68775 RepID=A0A5C3M195_9AGAR|nr:kinase-like domain-containing protein [Crucibulum laeve]
MSPSDMTSPALPLSHIKGKIPKGRDLTNEKIQLASRATIGYGGATDVYRGEWFGKEGTILVAIKVYRGGHLDDKIEETNRRLVRETHTWCSLKHKNILPFYGWSKNKDIAPSTSLICPLLLNGHIIQYLNNTPDANRSRLVADIASGLNYLHTGLNEGAIIHGDLKPNNVLIGNDGTALLADFGRSIVLDFDGYMTAAMLGCGEYMAPELFQDTGDKEPGSWMFTKESDVYSFSLLAFQIMTDYIPLSINGKGRHPTHIPGLVKKGKRPTRDLDEHGRISDSLWELLTDGWSATLSKRPTVKVMCECPQLNDHINADDVE